jgi:AcrR family transcriptional regulator
MPRTEPGDARQRLLDAAVDYAAHHGVSDLGLRQLATALGTSHRMLIYHFGSKDGLLVEIVRAVEARQRQLLADLTEQIGLDDGTPPVERLVSLWRHFADPALAPWERLFFEVYGQALQGRPHTAAFLDDVVDSWLGPIAAATEAAGMDEDDARAQARVMVAVTRGLLLDLLATGDRDGVDEAMSWFAARIAPPAAPHRSSGSGAATLSRSSRSRAPASR